MKRIIIIDDEAPAREHLRNLLTEYCPEVEIIGEANGVTESFKLIRQLQPDAILLDVQMDDGTGFDLMDKFRTPAFNVIFQTAFDEFAIKAFKYNAVDYLLKPIDIEELIQAIDKIEAGKSNPAFTEQLSGLLETAKEKKFERIVLNSSEGMHFIELEDIVRLNSDVNYTTFYLASGERITVTKTIKTFEELLPNDSFFRPHQSHIVNLNYVTKILREDGGYALMKDGSKVSISRNKKEAFIEALKERTGK
ncbi:MAG: response regulator transcription factor [Lewinellaceae bacterium]|nr:response regulator transcription factor [Lewinellaceae bacterium]